MAKQRYPREGARVHTIEIRKSASLTTAPDLGVKVTVSNNTGASIAANSLVYVSGYDSTNLVPYITKAQATAAGHYATYVVLEAIADGAVGFAAKLAMITGQDTSGLTADDPVYLDDTTAGGWDSTKPTATDKIQVVGRVQTVHASTGRIMVDLEQGVQQIVHNHNDNAEGGAVSAFIPVSLYSLRETTSLDVGNIAANGGVLASDTTPVLEAINAATDGCQRILWAASNNDQVTFQVPLPPDIDTSSDVTVHMRIVSGGTTDAVGFTLASYFNEGDTAIADTSGTNQTTTYAEVTATIAAADVPSGAQTLTVGLTPVAHTTDTLALTAVWIEYTRT